MKEYFKKIANTLHLYITKNQYYDSLSEKIIKKCCTLYSNCIDIGSLKGDFLKIFLKYSPFGFHYCFEPLPLFYEYLKKKFKNNTNCQIFNVALSNESGESEFIYVKTNPAYSGFKMRTYEKTEKIEKIFVRKEKLDNIIPSHVKIDFIKIDVEGAELEVLEGGSNVIIKSQPLIIFEHGKGAAEHYNTYPQDIYDLIIKKFSLKIYTLKGFLDNSKNLSKTEFIDLFNNSKEYYFLATK